MTWSGAIMDSPSSLLQRLRIDRDDDGRSNSPPNRMKMGG